MAQEQKEQMVNAGWVTETIPELQPQNTVSDLLNMRIMSSSVSGSYKVEVFDGSEISFNVPDNYKPIGAGSIGNTILVFCVNESIERSLIGYVDFDERTETGVFKRLYISNEADFNTAFPIICKMIQESIDSIKGYFWDNRNKLRVINVNEHQAYVETDYLNTEPLVVGKKYTVLEGHVATGTNDYGDSFSDVDFVSDGTETALGPLTIVVPYKSIELINLQGKLSFNVPKFDQYIPGNKTCGSYYYFYQLTDNDGNGGQLSMASLPVILSGYAFAGSGNVMGDSQYFYGGALDDNSQKGIRISIDGLDTRYTKIKVISVKAISELEYETPQVFAFEDITGSSMTFDDSTNKGFDTLDISELISSILVILKNKDAAAIYNQFIIANYTTETDFLYDISSGVTSTTIQKKIPLEATLLYKTKYKNYTDAEAGDRDLISDPWVSDAGIGDGGQVVPLQDYVVEGGEINVENWDGSTVVYDATLAPIHFTTVDGDNIINFLSGAPTVFPEIVINKYGTEKFYKKIKGDFLNYRGATVSHYLKGYHDSETYRFAIMCHGLHGNPNYCHFLKDHEFEGTDVNTLGQYSLATGGSHKRVFTGNSLGVNFSNIDFNNLLQGIKDFTKNQSLILSDIPLFFEGFSIVRCALDKTIVASGMLWPIIGNGSRMFQQGHWYRYKDIYYATGSLRQINSFALLSPEVIFSSNSEFLDNDYLSIKSYLSFGSTLHDDSQDGNLMARGALFYRMALQTHNDPGDTFPWNNVIDKKWCAKLDVDETLIAGPLNLKVTEAMAVEEASLNYYSGMQTSLAPYVALHTIREMRGILNPYAFIFTKDDSLVVNYGNFDDNTRKPYVSLVRPKEVLYGGANKNAKATSTYFYCGHYQSFDNDFIAYLESNSGIANNIEIFGGDCHISLFDYCRAYCESWGYTTNVKVYSPSGRTYAGQFSDSLIFPVRTSMNLYMRQGRHVAKDLHRESYYTPLGSISSDGISYPTAAVTSPDQKEQYVYNTAYSSDVIYDAPLVAVPVGFAPQTRYEKTFAISLKKSDNELIDNWRNFSVNRTLTVENDGGPVYAVRAKKNQLFYWQRDALGYIPVNERVTIANATGKPVTLGEKSSIDRFDTLESKVGCQHTLGIAETDDGFYWFDALRKAWYYMEGGKSIDVSQQKQNIMLFKNNFFGDYVNNEDPLNGSGLIAGFNKRFNEAVFYFLGIKDRAGNELINIGIVFDVGNKQFNGKFIHSVNPGYLFSHYNSLLIFKGRLKQNGLEVNVLIPGKTIFDYQEDYFYTINDYTWATDPDYYNDSNIVHIGSNKAVHVFNRPNALGKMLGVFDDNYVEVVVNHEGSRGQAFIYEDMKANLGGTGYAFDEYEFASQNQFVNEAQSKRNYKIVNKLLEFSIPKDLRKALFHGPYLKAKFIKRNRLNDSPVTGKNIKTQLLSLTTFFKRDF
jgi:hypothetical protein